MRSPRTAMKSSPRSPQLEKACVQQRRPNTAKNKLKKKKKCCYYDYSHASGCEVVSHCGLICISLMSNDVEHLFMCLSAIHKSLVKCLSKSFAHFFLSCLSSYH